MHETSFPFEIPESKQSLEISPIATVLPQLRYDNDTALAELEIIYLEASRTFESAARGRAILRTGRDQRTSSIGRPANGSRLPHERQT